MKIALPADGGMNLSRRALFALGLGALAPKRARAATPSRIVCLEWTAAETVLALGVVPLAVGDTQGYRDWVAMPMLPARVQDLGSRFEPNRELLVDLHADLIVMAEGYGVEAADMRRFAPTFAISPFADGVRPLTHARNQAERLAARLGVPAAGRRLLGEFDKGLEQGRARLSAEAGRPVCVASIFEERTARVYGADGLIGDTIRALGLTNAWRDEVGPWGFAQIGFEQFARLPSDVHLVILDPVPEPVLIRLEANSLWNSLPPVREGRTSRIPPVWPFGGLEAAARFATLLTTVLTRSR